MFWHGIDQARQRLAGSVVLYDGKPVRFGGVEGRECEVRDIRTGKIIRLNLEDKKFNDFREIPPMGFVNVPNTLYYLRRNPVRSQTHGLIRGNVYVSYPSRGRFIRDGVNYDYLVERNGDNYADRCEGKYPTFEQAVDICSSEQPIAFCPKYALVQDRGRKTVFRGEIPIGILDGSSVLLGKTFLCFREELQENGVSQILEK